MSLTRRVRRVDPARLGSLALTAALIGLLAGLAGALFATVAAEPAIDDAIAIEEAASAAEQTEDDEARVDRSHQRGVGLFVAYALTGAAYGAVLALTAHALRGGRPRIGSRVLLAGTMLAGAFTLAPWFKYPPNPPAIGSSDSLAERQALYVVIIGIAIFVGIGAVIMARRLREAGWELARRVPVVAAAVAAPMLAAYALLPGAPDDIAVPAALVWRFRVGSLGANLTVWAVLTFALAWLASEAARDSDQNSMPLRAGMPAS